ncbi:VOC family protein [Sphingomonadaceae bacterium G21617-S1]|nr:VOC family protein [Sphingomonadaceae bacterium G21617-S1]
MAVRKLEHVNIRTRRLLETIQFYQEILDMEATPSPGGDMTKGAWIRDTSGQAIVHLVSADVPLTTRLSAPAVDSGSGAIDHVALECDGYEDMQHRMERHGLTHRCNTIPSIGLRQIFVEDPNGVLVELNFR